MGSGSLQLFDAGYTATLSECGRYRYTLTRAWRGTSQPHFRARTCLFVMLNPSTADATVDDPTIRKCVAFASHWGFSVLEVANLFAWRSTEPEGLIGIADPVGPKNDDAIVLALARANRVVLAWGSHHKVRGLIAPRERVVRALIVDAFLLRGHLAFELGSLGSNADKSPKHPLFLSVKKTPWVPA